MSKDRKEKEDKARKRKDDGEEEKKKMRPLVDARALCAHPISLQPSTLMSASTLSFGH